MESGGPARQDGGGATAALGWAVRIAHGIVFIATAFVLAILTVPVLALVVGGLQSALGPSAPETKDVVFYVWIPTLAIATIWVSRRINRWLARRAGRADPR